MLTLAAMLVAAAPASAGTDYLLQPGDSLDFNFIATPALRQKGVIGSDGKVSIPLLGQVKASEMSLTDFRERVRGMMNNRLYRQITTDGKENVVLLGADDLYVTVSAYRPVYLMGDVLKSGEIEFRPGLSVRHVLSMAGGVDRLKGRLVGPLDPVDFKGAYSEATAGYLAEKAKIIRIKAELDRVQPDFKSLKAEDLPIDLDAIIQAEMQQYLARQTDLQKERAFLADSITKAEKRVGVLTEQRDREAEGEKEDVAELERVQSLVQRGSAPITRVTDARRTSLFSATRVLQTATQVTYMERDREELRRKLVKLDDEYRVTILKDLQEANQRLNLALVRVATAREKLNVAGGSVFDGDEATPKITIWRDKVSIDGNLDSDVVPGDVVDVKMPPSRLGSILTKAASR